MKPNFGIKRKIIARCYLFDRQENPRIAGEQTNSINSTSEKNLEKSTKEWKQIKVMRSFLPRLPFKGDQVLFLASQIVVERLACPISA